MTDTTKTALETLLDFAARYIENQQESLPFTVNGDMTDEQIEAELDKRGDIDPYEMDNALDVRNFDRAAKTVNMILKQRGCEHLDGAVSDGKLTTLCDVVVFG